MDPKYHFAIDLHITTETSSTLAPPNLSNLSTTDQSEKLHRYIHQLIQDPSITPKRSEHQDTVIPGRCSNVRPTSVSESHGSFSVVHSFVIEIRFSLVPCQSLS